MRRALPILLLGLSLTSAAAGQSPDPLLEVRTADPAELARAAARMGDQAVLDRLDEEQPTDTRLAAVRAAPFIVGPEAAIAQLAELAAGRHPTLAPAAAMSLLRIAETLSFGDLERREVDPSSLADALERLDALAADETARPDLRAAASHVAQQLRLSVVP